ncbi:MAG: diguanylate cyclase [Trichloromonadaceae bacterium]
MTIRATGISLNKKILRPFFITILLLGLAATVGSGLLISQALSKNADQRLSTIQQILIREIKEHELLLERYASLLEFSHTLARQNPSDGTGGILLDQIYAALGKADISIAFFPAGAREAPSAVLEGLFQQTLRSGKPRFRFTAEPGSPPSLSVASPMRALPAEEQILLLQTPMDADFLKEHASTMHAELQLLSIDGQVLSASDATLPAPELSDREIETILIGRNLYRTNHSLLSRRQVIAAVPLGTTDMILLSVDIPMADLDGLVQTLATRSALTIALALLLGSYVFLRILRKAMRPLDDLLTATEEVSQGHFSYRIPRLTSDEFGTLARAFNGMVGQLETLYEERIAQKQKLTLVQEELKYKGLLEQKNREIERVNRDLKGHLKDISGLFQLNQAMTSTLDQNTLFERMFQVLRELTHCTRIVLLLYNPGNEELEIRKAFGLATEALDDVTFRLDEGITGVAARSQELVYVPDISQDLRSLNYKGRTTSQGSLACLPLVIKQRLVGILNLHKDDLDAFSEQDLKLIQAIGNQAAIAIENAQLYEKTRDLSNTDELTSLANRRHFQGILKREVDQAKRYNTTFSLIMLDVDHFKQFNDTHGHLAGDLVLKRVANILLQNTRGIDLAARFGGEEFIILLPRSEEQGALATAEKLRQCVHDEAISGMESSQPLGRLTLSLGIAVYPQHSKDIFDLINMADQALYQAKSSGRNRCVVWTPPV